MNVDLYFSAALRAVAERATLNDPLLIADQDTRHEFVMLPWEAWEQRATSFVSLSAALDQCSKERDDLQFRMEGLEK